SRPGRSAEDGSRNRGRRVARDGRRSLGRPLRREDYAASRRFRASLIRDHDAENASASANWTAFAVGFWGFPAIRLRTSGIETSLRSNSSRRETSSSQGDPLSSLRTDPSSFVLAADAAGATLRPPSDAIPT